MEESQSAPHQGAGEPISRPNSTSAAEAAVSQLLGMTGINEGAGATSANADANEPLQEQSSSNDAPSTTQPESQHQPQTTTAPSYNGATPAATAGGNSNGLPTCQNCSTSTTPLWRRDEYGSVLCNACGLFLKLHGRPRPISLKTDVIKSRNRVKTMRPDMAGKKKNPTPSQTTPGARKHSGPAHPDGTNESPISRTGTPSMYSQPLPSFMMDDPYSSTSVPGYGANGDGSGSPMNGDTPQTHEQLIAANSSLKTRVRELELINELFRGRLSQLEQQEAAARRGNEVAGAEQSQLRTQLEASQDAEKSLRAQLEDSHRRENSLKRRLDELELELKDAKDAVEDLSDRPAKKARVQSPEQTETRRAGSKAASEERTERQPEEPTDAKAEAAAEPAKS